MTGETGSDAEGQFASTARDVLAPALGGVLVVGSIIFMLARNRRLATSSIPEPDTAASKRQPFARSLSLDVPGPPKHLSGRALPRRPRRSPRREPWFWKDFVLVVVTGLLVGVPLLLAQVHYDDERDQHDIRLDVLIGEVGRVGVTTRSD